MNTPNHSSDHNKKEELSPETAPVTVNSEVTFDREMKEKLNDKEWDEVENIDKNFDIESAKKVNIENLLFDVDDDAEDDEMY